MTFEQIMAAPIVGCFHYDAPLFSAISVFVINEKNPLDQRLRAFARFDELTGENDPIDEQALAWYVNFIKENC